jgi:hypothetical protein
MPWHLLRIDGSRYAVDISKSVCNPCESDHILRIAGPRVLCTIIEHKHRLMAAEEEGFTNSHLSV